MAQHHNGAIRNDLLLRPGPRILGLFDVKSTFAIHNTYCRPISADMRLCWHCILCFERSPCVECMDKTSCFLLKHRAIIATAYWILLLKPSSALCQCHPCSHAFHELIVSEKQTSSLMCETKIDRSVLPFIACVICMTALLPVSPVFLRNY